MWNENIDEKREKNICHIKKQWGEVVLKRNLWVVIEDQV